MIHLETWYREADVGGTELRRLQEQALRGGPEEKENLLRYYIRIDKPPTGALVYPGGSYGFSFWTEWLRLLGNS
ncbi:MAG: hypothetical protein Q8P59_01385 [Dehalococcoidia bacterium]|nr:hypothetical protein [Dehalococcoidia bacterium]